MQDANEPVMAQHESHSAPAPNSDGSNSSKPLAQVWLDAAATASPGQHTSVRVCSPHLCFPKYLFAVQLHACLLPLLLSRASKDLRRIDAHAVQEE